MYAAFALQAGGAIAAHRAQARANRENQKAALADLRLQQYDAGLRQQEEMIAGSQAVRQVRREGTATRADASASAASAGVSGMAVDFLLGSITANESAAVENLEAQTEVTLAQLQRVKQGAHATAQNRINAVPSPSLLATGAQVLGAGIDLYGRMRLSRPTTDTRINTGAAVGTRTKTALRRVKRG
jgi:hypothetical protein